MDGLWRGHNGFELVCVKVRTHITDNLLDAALAPATVSPDCRGLETLPANGFSRMTFCSASHDRELMRPVLLVVDIFDSQTGLCLAFLNISMAGVES